MEQVKEMMGDGRAGVKLAAWWLEPLHVVGDGLRPLRYMPTQEDSVKTFGDGSIPYTSWGCFSRSYLGGGFYWSRAPAQDLTGVVLEPDAGAKRPTPSLSTASDPIPQAEKEAMTPRQKNQFRSGTLIYKSGHGFLKPKDWVELATRTRSDAPVYVEEVATGIGRVEIGGYSVEDLKTVKTGAVSSSTAGWQDYMVGDDAKTYSTFRTSYAKATSLYDALTAPFKHEERLVARPWEGMTTEDAVKMFDEILADLESGDKNDKTREKDLETLTAISDTTAVKALLRTIFADSEVKNFRSTLGWARDTWKATEKDPVGSKYSVFLNIWEPLYDGVKRLSLARKKLRERKRRQELLAAISAFMRLAPEYKDKLVPPTISQITEVTGQATTESSTNVAQWKPAGPDTPGPPDTKTTTAPTATKTTTTTTATVSSPVAGSSAGASTTQVTAAPTPLGIYADVLPVRVCMVSSNPEPEEIDRRPAPTSTMDNINNRLTQTDNLNALGSLVKSPLVRDALDYTVIVRAVAERLSTYMEHAVLVRCLCVLGALEHRDYRLDPIMLRYVRGVRTYNNIESVLFRGAPQVQTFNLMAAHLTTFTRIVAGTPGYEDFNAPFRRSNLDLSWCAVPIDTIALNADWLPAYVACHLSSELWNGTVNIVTRYGVTSPAPENEMFTDVNYTIMPVCNGVFIPGMLNAVLVLVDEGAPPPNQAGAVSFLGTRLPIVNGPPGAAVDVLEAWKKYWVETDVEVLQRHFLAAYEHINLRQVALNSNNTAASIASELFGINTPGVHVRTTESDIRAYDWTVPGLGAYTYTGADINLSGSAVMHSNNMGELLLAADKGRARQAMTGYNFAGVSPLHLSPTGAVLTRHETLPKQYFQACLWGTSRPNVAVPAYKLKTMTSLARMAIYIGLFVTDTHPIKFTTPGGAEAWLHMNASALSLLTATFLNSANISLRVWAGFDNRAVSSTNREVVRMAKASAFNELVVHVPASEADMRIQDAGMWGYDCIGEYYDMLVWDNSDWNTYSAVPYHAAQQWFEKMQILGGDIPPSVPRKIPTQPSYLMVIEMKLNNGIHLLHGPATPHVARRLPVVIEQRDGAAMRSVAVQIEAWSTISAVATRSPRGYLDRWETGTPTFEFTEDWGMDHSVVHWTLLTTVYTSSNPVSRLPVVTEIMWPDPPSGFLSRALGWAKNYILKPGIAALLGWATGGPAGAVIGGATQLVREVAAKVSPTQEAQDKVTVMEEAARKVANAPKTEIEEIASKGLAPSLLQNQKINEEATSLLKNKEGAAEPS